MEANPTRVQQILDLVERAAPANRRLAKERSLLARLDRELASRDLLSETVTKVVGLCGISYCGSTFLGLLLGSLPGVHFVGETHRLTKSTERNEKQESKPYAFTDSTDDTLTPCNHCGTNCIRFPRDFRRALQDDPTNWYFRIARQLRAATLITSDKGLLFETDVLQRYQPVILFKHPAIAFESFERQYQQGLRTNTYFRDYSEFARVWADAYLNFLETARYNQHPLIVLSWEHFTRDPARHLARLCDLLGLSFDHSVLTARNSEQHTFGGNQAANNDFRSSSATRIRVRTNDQSKRRSRHPYIHAIYSRLIDHYQRDFPTQSSLTQPIKPSIG